MSIEGLRGLGPPGVLSKPPYLTASLLCVCYSKGGEVPSVHIICVC